MVTRSPAVTHHLLQITLIMADVNAVILKLDHFLPMLIREAASKLWQCIPIDSTYTIIGIFHLIRQRGIIRATSELHPLPKTTTCRPDNSQDLGVRLKIFASSAWPFWCTLIGHLLTHLNLNFRLAGVHLIPIIHPVTPLRFTPDVLVLSLGPHHFPAPCCNFFASIGLVLASLQAFA